MEILENKNITRENISKVKHILFKASNNPQFSKYITEDKIQEALSNTIVCKDEDEFIKQVDLVVPGASKEASLIYGLKAFQAVESKKIVLRNDCNVETITHELVHYFSLDDKGTGILNIGEEIISDKENHDWDKVNPLHIDVLNEAMTHYITQELLPDVKVEDAYTYGANFLEDYAKASGNSDKILESYFGKNKDSLDFIAKDINKEGIISWHDILEASGVHQYTNMRIFKRFEQNYKKCADERKRIDNLITTIQNKNKDSKNVSLEDEDLER